MPEQSGATDGVQDEFDVSLAAIPDAIAQSVRCFLAAVQQQRRVEAAYLYGSQVKGTSTQWSDIDVAVISYLKTVEPALYRRLKTEASSHMARRRSRR